ncbi:MAG: DUF3060 domain-containing protein [Mycobacterium sp.]|nr:DUF3060 domain-containing protein [Mycobacterium sp.]MBV9722786.1 DUF3060 domain-containing protein [Mycobacterium sp.]
MAIALTLAAAVLIFGIAGCGPKHNRASSTSSPTSAGGQLDIGNTINYGSLGTVTTLDCDDGKSLNVGGNNNTLTVRGTCETVSVGGADNKITIDKIDKHLTAVGINNTIIYKDGNPEVEILGNNNTITKAS